MTTLLSKLVEWIENEIPERRDYSASKTYEVVLEKIEQLKKEEATVNCRLREKHAK